MFRFVLDLNNGFGIVQGIILVGFFVFFIGVIVWAIFAKKRYMDHMSKLPLQENNSIKEGQ